MGRPISASNLLTFIEPTGLGNNRERRALFASGLDVILAVLRPISENNRIESGNYHDSSNAA